MGLFGKREKKTCAICGKELGLFGKTKLEDGYLCKECAGKLSPFFDGARHSTADQIRQQLEYREGNETVLESFSPTRELGGTWRVLIDDNKRGVVVTDKRDWRAANPDVINFADVKDCDVRVDESRRELYRQDEDGHRQSYSPPRYEYSYDFWVTVRVDNPYFGTIKFKLNDWSVDRRPSAEYDRYEREAYEIRNALTNLNAPLQQASQPAASQPAAYQQSASVGTTGYPQHSQQSGYPQQPHQQPSYQQASPRTAYAQQTGFQQRVVQPAQQSAGQASASAFCPNCGAPVKPGARFCESCGSALV